MSDLTGQQIWKLLAESYKDRPNEASISFGMWSEVPREELSIYNMPEFEATMSLTMADVRRYAEQPADPPADREQAECKDDFTCDPKANPCEWCSACALRFGRDQVRRAVLERLREFVRVRSAEPNLCMDEAPVAMNFEYCAKRGDLTFGDLRRLAADGGSGNAKTGQ